MKKLKKYQVIYADPPWKYYVYSKKGLGRSAEHHYPTMSIDDIKKLPIQEIAEKDCMLFLWVTFPTLLESFEVIRAWGFQYKTVAFVWIKQNKKVMVYFGAWAIGQEQMQKYACLRPKDTLSEYPKEYIKLSYLI